MSGLGDNEEVTRMAPSTDTDAQTVHALPRPRLMPQQSNSVPSTPRQHPRDFIYNARTPSPSDGDGRDSPRSVTSEAPRALPSLRTVSVNCRYMSTQTSRRRMPYTIGTDPLEKDKDSHKATLETSENEKLSGDIRNLYERLLPSPDSQGKRQQVVEKLQRILSDAWPGKAIQVAIFGSSGNLLFTSKSDVDICVTMRELQTTCALADLLAKRGMQKVTCVHAKAVPIVKIWDPELGLACDLNVNNQVAVKNTRLVKTYIELDDRVRPLAMIVKHWTKKRVINEASGGTLSSYTWTLLLINFLQTRQPPILPVIPLSDGNGQPKSDFAEDLMNFHAYGEANKESIGELLFQFFRHYGHEMDYNTSVVSVRAGKLLTKTEKRWHLATNNMLCVEEPFNTDRNLANTADDTAFRGLHLEFRQAFQRIAEAKDIETSVCEQFEFPEGGTRTVFERPAPQPKPVLSRSQSQSGRAPRMNGGVRGNRFQSGQRNGTNSRRASNPPAYNQNLMVQSPQIIYSPTEYLLRASPQQLQHAQSGLQDQLNQLSQQLSHEEQRLRAQQFMLSQAQLQQAQSQTSSAGQGRSATLPLRSPGLPMLHNYRGSKLGSMEEPPATAPLHRAHAYSPMYDSSMPVSPQGTQQGGTDTNPSSPLLTPSVPLRRQYQRPSAQTTASNVNRSQSQPARTVPQGYALPRSQFTPMSSSLSHMQLANGVPRQNFIGPFMGPLGQFYLPAPPMEQIPREYLGYGFGTSPQYVAAYTDHPSSSLDAFEQTQPATPSATQSTSLPDWLDTPLHDYGRNGVDSTVLSSRGDGMQSNRDAPQSSVTSGPVIVNGSSSSGYGNADTPRYAPQRRRTLDLPYRPEQGPSYSTPHAHLGNVSQDVPTVVDEPLSFTNTPTDRRSPHNANALRVPGSEHSTIFVPDSATSPEPLSLSLSNASNTSAPRADSETINPSAEGLSSRRSSGGSRAPVPALDLSSSSYDATWDNPSTPASILSPVREMSSPGPPPTVSKTASEKAQSHSHSVNGVNGVHGRAPATNLSASTIKTASPATVNENSRPPIQADTVSHPSGTSTVPSRPSTNSANPWQQAIRKGKKGKNPSIDRMEVKTRGEPMPVNEAERKGG